MQGWFCVLLLYMAGIAEDINRNCEWKSNMLNIGLLNNCTMYLRTLASTFFEDGCNIIYMNEKRELFFD